MVFAAIHGARGYLGRELCRILTNHPRVDRLALVTSGTGGEPYGATVPNFAHRKDLVLVSQDDPGIRDADVHFLATDNAEALATVQRLGPDAPTIIDLSRAHRLQALAGDSPWTYGLSELFPVPKGSRRIANPGCYPTATLLASAPLLASALLGDGPLISDGKSGVSGAGATPRADLHYPEANESVRAYKVLGHDHLHEIQAAAHRIEGAAPWPAGKAEGRALGAPEPRSPKARPDPRHATPTAAALASQAAPMATAPSSQAAPTAAARASQVSPAAAVRPSPARPRPVRFTPHLVPMNRGLLATVYLPLTPDATPEAVKALYASAYGQALFLRLVAEPHTAHVRGGNFVDLAVDVDVESGLMVARSAIDNLVKGGSGQAVQNMNHAFGFPETLGLEAPGGGP